MWSVYGWEPFVHVILIDGGTGRESIRQAAGRWTQPATGTGTCGALLKQSADDVRTARRAVIRTANSARTLSAICP